MAYLHRILSKAGCRSPRKIMMEKMVFVITCTRARSSLKESPLHPFHSYSNQRCLTPSTLKMQTSSFALPTAGNSVSTGASCPSLHPFSGTCLPSLNLSTPPTTFHTSTSKSQRQHLTSSSATYTRSPLQKSRTSPPSPTSSPRRRNTEQKV